MAYFLEKLAGNILDRDRQELKGLRIVVPNRRAGLYIKKYIAVRIKSTIELPAIISIQDFVTGITDAKVPGNLQLAYGLYKEYGKYFEEEEPFDKFYPWGEMILGDFDMVDRSLVDAEMLFRNIKNLKEIEEEFTVSLYDLEAFRKFWETFTEREITAEQKKFLKTWEILGRVYGDFKERLTENGEAYEGMLYREIAENTDAYIKKLKGDSIIFAGFNILSRSEEKIMKAMLDRGTAEIFWDADKYYTDDDKQEAGRFLRKNFRKLVKNPPGWTEDRLGTEEKKITVYSVPFKTGQVKSMCARLEDIAGGKDFDAENTAVVLPDESMLIPLLNSLPQAVKDINITMGYSLKNTPLYTLLELVKDLHNNSDTNSKGETFFNHRDVLQVLMHPYVKFAHDSKINTLIREMVKNNWVYINGKVILGNSKSELVKEIFSPVRDTGELYYYLIRTIGLIKNETGQRKGGRADVESEQFEHFKYHLKKLNDIITSFDEEIPQEAYWNILISTLASAKIPFTGEPLMGLQIMGVLETRLLDFENVFMLSMNEGTFPKTEYSNSFIPFNLRKGFGLPTYEDDDSGFAYNFYRLMQRTKNAHLFYNSEVGDFASGEKSRYLSQVEYELCEVNKNVEFKELIVKTPFGIPTGEKISIEKTDGVMEKLKSLKSLSSSSLSVYINCPLQFYYRYAAGLKEKEDIDEVIDPAKFGTLFHEVLSRLYSPLAGTEIHEDTLLEARAQVRDVIEEVFKEELPEDENYPEEKKVFMMNILAKLAERVLEGDAEQVPFTPEKLEEEYECEMEIEDDLKVKLKGVIDRVEIKNGEIRIIDYKTGSVQGAGAGKVDDENLMERIFSEPKSREDFQSYLYAYLYLRNNVNGSVKAGIYPVRKISSGMIFQNKGQALGLSDMEDYEKRLKAIISEIFDGSKPFEQTKDEDRCMYCEFKTICNRE